MRRATLAAAVALVAACGSDVTGPPTGLPAALVSLPAGAGSIPEPTIVARGDSIASILGLPPACASSRAVAGWAGARVVITVVDSSLSEPCPDLIPNRLRAVVVRPAPRGTYQVDVVQRRVARGELPVSTTLASATVTVP